ncbi:HNH endonuclease signature motif containing protein [Pseudonocardia broussonetiae]|uniref:DUF222 domain-containing protein n=1 Tax=Pseudonocardia broussonetiae TaxID=2736640 RepID=A0A6M6JGU9_9PSEU|nr:HNH endonuclease signature motif containing protein [Pseudonocardia broussonetiae]QJY45621.1 DUF222 domain-containing protein [Pseudonocardia broussonetiae]
MFDSEVLDLPPEQTLGNTAPSGLFGLELEFATESLGVLSDTELVDAAVGFERLAAWAAARQAAVLAEFQGRSGDGSVRAVSAAVPLREWASDEIGMALTVSRGTAQVRLAQARRLSGVLRPTRDLLEGGRLCWSRARLVCDRLALLDDTLAAAVQDRVLPAAPGQTWAQLDAALRRAILALDPDGAAARHRSARVERRVDVFAGEDGMATLWARLTAPDAASSYAWLTRLARGLGADDPRTLDQRRADLLAAVLTGRLVLRDPAAAADTVAVVPVTPGKPLITVLVPHSTLTGFDDAPCELVGYGPIPALLAREVAADAVWRRLVSDPLTGTVLEYGRTTYRPPAALADHVRARDITCRAPGCRRPAATCELDHVVPWDPGGTTGEDNLVALCPAHHDLKEQPGWQTELRPDRALEWTTPTGHRYRTGRHDHRVR